MSAIVVQTVQVIRQALAMYPERFGCDLYQESQGHGFVNQERKKKV
jgi:hypothetical protein